MSDFAEVEARIRQLNAHYTDAVWRKDPLAFGQCFTADAQWRIAGRVMQGRDEIVRGFERLMVNANRVLITFRTPQLDWRGGGEAAARAYVTEQCTWNHKEPNINIGCYYERFAEGEDRWRFSWRLFQLLYQGPADLSGMYYEHADYGPWPAMPPADAVPAAIPEPAVQ